MSVKTCMLWIIVSEFGGSLTVARTKSSQHSLRIRDSFAIPFCKTWNICLNRETPEFVFEHCLPASPNFSVLQCAKHQRTLWLFGQQPRFLFVGLGFDFVFFLRSFSVLRLPAVFLSSFPANCGTVKEGPRPTTPVHRFRIFLIHNHFKFRLYITRGFLESFVKWIRQACLYR